MSPINRLNRRSVAIAACAVAGLVSVPAYAHFVLLNPPSFAAQSGLGDPQKNPPCGQSGDPVGPSGVVTPFDEGGTITIMLEETIYHPGHYRVSVAADPESLPADPPVTPGDTDCGSTVIEPNPTLPLLADGLLAHDSSFGGPQMIQVELPAGFTCDECTLQVVEFMSNHGLNNPGGCFYHHCAQISVGAAGGVDAGSEDGADAGDGDAPADDDDGGCGCRTRSGGGWGGGLLAALTVGLVALRRRRRRTPVR